MKQGKCINGKNRYENQTDAKRAAQLGMQLRQSSNLDTYFCLFCYGWHLTSKKRK